MTKDKLGSGAFTGDANGGNPYSGDRGKGIDYDTYESESTVIEQEGNFPNILTPYRAGARKLVQYVSASRGETVMDLGSGTGILTLELLVKNPEISVLGLEISEGMMEVAEYKFHQIDGTELRDNVSNDSLLKYWEGFRRESDPHKNRVNFVLGDIQTTEDIIPESINRAVANQVFHWTDLPTTFKQMKRFLKKGGEVIWNTASHFYDDERFPAKKYAFRYNDFLRSVMDEVSSRVKVSDYREMANPKQNINSIQEVSSSQGLITEQVGTFLLPVDFQNFIRYHVPVFVRTLITSEMGNDEKDQIAKEAIERTINRTEALGDIVHKYDIVPILKSVKI